MKLRHPLARKFAGLGGAWLLRYLLGSLQFRYHCLGVNVSPHLRRRKARYIYALWHEYLLLPMYQFRDAGVAVLISEHRDGELANLVGRQFGLRVVRGSTTRGGVPALRRLIALGRASSLALTVDGPRGPRRRVKLGVAYLAAQTGMAIVPTGVAYERPWRLRSWDRLAVPRPGSRAVAVADAPIVVPPYTNRTQMERYRLLVEERMMHATALAEDWASRGRLLKASA
jgi:lysophospholipid acyltransferase (LPLAT)-like uncharacterized protein